MSKQIKQLRFKISNIPDDLKSNESWQVIIRVTNKHGVAVSGRMCAEYGFLDHECKLFAILPGTLNAVDFRSDDKIITRIYAESPGLLCSHIQPHVFAFNLTNPINGMLYDGVVPA